MEMDGGAVLGVSAYPARPHPRPHEGGVHRDEEVARGARAKLVVKLDAYRLAIEPTSRGRGNDDSPGISDRTCGR